MLTFTLNLNQVCKSIKVCWKFEFQDANQGADVNIPNVDEIGKNQGKNTNYPPSTKNMIFRWQTQLFPHLMRLFCSLHDKSKSCNFFGGDVAAVPKRLLNAGSLQSTYYAVVAYFSLTFGLLKIWLNIWLKYREKKDKF